MRVNVGWGLLRLDWSTRKNCKVDLVRINSRMFASKAKALTGIRLIDFGFRSTKSSTIFVFSQNQPSVGGVDL